MDSSPSAKRSISPQTPRPVLALFPGGPGRVPLPLTALVGRERELAVAEALIHRADVRLLTLTGPGGIGKTRLALKLAVDLADGFADGVRFVPLASILDASLVAASIANAAGVQPAGGISILDAMTSVLQSQNVLLVVDNFEHVLPAASILTDLLAKCPRLKILATSRVLLRVAGEHALAVPPLALPDPRSSPSLENLIQSPAIQLFTDRAQSVEVSFALTEISAPQVAEICRRLDGLPLAIELVAPRVRHLALQDLIDRLNQRLPLLTGGSKDQPSRLQTMRNAIAWSHDLLTPDAQAIFRRIAVFTGGFSLEAAEQVGSGEMESLGTVNFNVFDGLATLIDASLLRTEIRADGATRYRMLETIREYALEQLAASNETVAVRNAHAAHFTAFAMRYELADLLPDGDQAVAKLEIEHANLRAALVWLEESGQNDSFLRLATALGRFWSGQGQYQEGRTWLNRAVRNGSSLAMSDRAKALVSLGMITLFQGANQEGEVFLTEGLTLCRDYGHLFHEARALIGLGGLATLRGNLDQGASYLQEALTTSHAVEDQRMAEIMAGWALINLAVVARTRGDFTLAAEQLEEALDLVREAKYVTGTILALGDRGDLARDIGDHRRALGLYQEALGLARDNPGTREVRDVVEAVAIASIAIGQAEHGARLLGATEAMRERMGLQYRVAETQAALEQAVTSARSSLGDTTFTAAWSAGRELQSSQAVAEALQPIDLPPNVLGVSLTPREREVLILLAEGLTDPAIADELFLSVRTVESHVAHILAKIGVRTRTAAASAAIASGLAAAGAPPHA